MACSCILKACSVFKRLFLTAWRLKNMTIYLSISVRPLHAIKHHWQRIKGLNELAIDFQYQSISWYPQWVLIGIHYHQSYWLDSLENIYFEFSVLCYVISELICNKNGYLCCRACIVHKPWHFYPVLLLTHKNNEVPMKESMPCWCSSKTPIVSLLIDCLCPASPHQNLSQAVETSQPLLTGE